MKIMEKVPAEMSGKIRSRVEGLDMDTVQICCGSTFKDDDTFVAIAREWVRFYVKA